MTLDVRCRRRSTRITAVLLLVLAGIAAGPARAQGMIGPDVLAEAGVSDGEGAASWLAAVTVASAPLPLGHRWDFGAAARVSHEPVVSMVRSGDGIEPAYLDAFRFSASIAFTHSADAFDVVVVGRFAETRLDDGQRQPPAGNDNGPWTFLFDATVHVRAYATRDRGATAVTGAQRRLALLVDAFAGVRHDRRFHRDGDLQPYDDPTGRFTGGVMIGVWRWRSADGAPRLGVRAGADFETALRSGTRLPAAGRMLVVADIDLRRVVRQRELTQ